MTDILTKIADRKRDVVAELKKQTPLESFVNSLSGMPVPRFRVALSQTDRVNIIAEIKKGSPSKGIMVADFDPAHLAQQYKEGGACALSVLTEEEHFFGHTAYMRLASEKSGLPILCKDFIIDPYQLYHAKLKGADAVLLIARLHNQNSLTEFIDLATEIGLDYLVEAHDEEELQLALDSGANVVGINNRDLTDFSVSLKTSERLAPLIPEGVIRVTESGISSTDDILRMRKAGFNSFLIGEALVTSPDPVRLLRSLREA